ncbi:hypothetical protein GCM10023186_32700 [Hymenobacter koreensis]|uniref:Uncharacterized protein n=1 Tax=Hymenobacter koreensis TaxID=1084523 RepID=A0ABP8J9F7_9BACT
MWGSGLGPAGSVVPVGEGVSVSQAVSDKQATASIATWNGSVFIAEKQDKKEWESRALGLSPRPEPLRMRRQRWEPQCAAKFPLARWGHNHM